MLRARWWRLAARISLGHRSESVTESIALACDLIRADVATSPVVAGGACPLTRLGVMLALGSWRCSKAAEVPQVQDESTALPIVLRAFGFCDLPLADFFAPFLTRLPAWDEQDGLERSLNLLLDELDHAADPQARDVVIARTRAAVRDAMG